MKGHTYVSLPVDKQGNVQWSAENNDVWRRLVERQTKIVEGRACDEFLEGLEILNFPKDRVVQIPEVNKILDKCTGWGVEPVPAIIPPKEFFTLLANKRFPAATFIRIPAEMDYLQEPDIFHEVYGHTPLLTHQAYADFMEKFGKLALEAEPKDRFRLFRLFWFTIEFGMLKNKKGEYRAYGGGILSSIGETQYCMTDQNEKVPFDALTALRTPYRIDIMQPLYYVINGLDDLFEIMQLDILKLVAESKRLGDFAPKYQPKENELIGETAGPMKC